MTLLATSVRSFASRYIMDKEKENKIEENEAEESSVDVVSKKDGSTAIVSEISSKQDQKEDETLKIGFNTKVDVYNDKEEKKSKKKSSSGKKAASNKAFGAVKKTLGTKIPKTVQETIPYYSVYKNGIIETEPGVFSKSYLLFDANFKIATDEDQKTIFISFGKLLNMFGPSVHAEITVFNKNIDINRFRKEILLKMKGDDLDKYREESNEILLAKITEGKNSVTQEKYLTLSIEADGIESAMSTFGRLDTEVSTAVKAINGSDAPPLSIEERLLILYNIYNMDGATLPIDKQINGKNVESFNLSALRKMGLTTKDVIAPPSIVFSKDYMQIGDKYARAMFLDNLPSFLTTDVIPELTSVECNMLTSIHYESLRQDKTIKLIRNQIVNINSNVLEAQKKAARSGYSAELISTDLANAQDEATKLMEDITTRNQKMFLVSLVCTIFADTLDELNKYAETLQTIASKHLCQLKNLSFQQEYGFATSLPLAYNKIYVQRLLTTESAAVLMPFSTQELSQSDGMYYGLNAISKNLILYNRKSANNQNGVILGTPGSGKSFSAKREMINVILNTDDEIYIIDPEREYTPLAKMFNGEVVRIAAGSNTHINPFDMDLDYADDDDPITLKSDFIGSLCETVIGGRYGLSPTQKTIIDRCVRRLYEGYIQQKSRAGDTAIDTDNTPTLLDFYNLLREQPEIDAANIALSLELYCKGSLDTFAHKTNVNTNSRVLVYDIKDIGAGLKNMGLQVCLNDVWNKTIANKKKGKRTWFYIDEFYLLTQTETSARFLQQIWKRARKWGGVPTGITQNVEDLLASKEARGIINNCDFVLMLNQSPLDGLELSRMFNISPAQKSYITNSEPGKGLLYNGRFIIPFIDKFPKGNSLYNVMTTRPDEVQLDGLEVKPDE